MCKLHSQHNVMHRSPKTQTFKPLQNDSEFDPFVLIALEESHDFNDLIPIQCSSVLHQKFFWLHAPLSSFQSSPSLYTVGKEWRHVIHLHIKKKPCGQICNRKVESHQSCTWFGLWCSGCSLCVCRWMTNVWSRLSSGVAGVSVCPPVALDTGVGLLCRLLELWGQVPAGVLTLTEWLLGEEEDGDEADEDKASGLVREVFKGTIHTRFSCLHLRLHFLWDANSTVVFTGLKHYDGSIKWPLSWPAMSNKTTST